MNEFNKGTGVLIDERTEEQLAKDFLFEELVTSPAPVKWTEKTPNTWRKFPIFNQDNSGSCVAQTMRKMLGIYVWLKTGVWVSLSAAHIYQRRFNRPDAGMAGDDVFKIAQQGTTLEEFAPAENVDDSKMDAVVVTPFMSGVGQAFSIGAYLKVAELGNIDKVASIIQKTGKGVMVWFYFSNGLTPREWKAIPETKHKLELRGATTARHSITAVDFTLLGKTNLPKHPQFWGKRALICDESWGLDNNVTDTAKITDKIITINGQHIITEDFFKQRNYFIGYFMNFAFEDPETSNTAKPKATFYADMEFSAAYVTRPDVVLLQDVLKYEGLFPKNTDSTGYFGSVTKKAVEAYQLKYNITDASSAGFGRVGPVTRKHLNSRYS